MGYDQENACTYTLWEEFNKLRMQAIGRDIKVGCRSTLQLQDMSITIQSKNLRSIL